VPEIFQRAVRPRSPLISPSNQRNSCPSCLSVSSSTRLSLTARSTDTKSGVSLYTSLPEMKQVVDSIPANYALETIHQIVNSCPILHVSFQAPNSPFPVVLPMIGQMGSFSRPSADLGDVLDLYLHGSVCLFRSVQSHQGQLSSNRHLSFHPSE